MTSVTKEGRVEFWFFRREVSDVRVVGDFAASGDGGFPMTDGRHGWWRVKIELDPGEYRFRYVADGVWYTDYASNGVEVSNTGINSLLVVPEREGHAAAARAAKLVA